MEAGQLELGNCFLPLEAEQQRPSVGVVEHLEGGQGELGAVGEVEVGEEGAVEAHHTEEGVGGLGEGQGVLALVPTWVRSLATAGTRVCRVRP